MLFYFKHRCAICRATDQPFDQDAQEAIHENFRGNMHAIDRLTLGALELAAEGDAEAV